MNLNNTLKRQVCGITNGGAPFVASKLLLTSANVENGDDKTSKSGVDKNDSRKKRTGQV
jgi:hypothetical protein